MYHVLYTLNGLLMITIPLVIGRFLALRRRASWALFAIGAATFVLSQVGHIPFNLVIQPMINQAITGLSDQSQLLVTAVFLGLSAGLFEETARYLTYRYWATDARTWGKGLMLGAGHGGVEAILLGISAIASVYMLDAYRQGSLPMQAIPAEARLVLENQIQTVFSAPWYGTLLGAIERLFAVCFHLSASLLVMQTLVRRQWFWLPAAVLWHALLNAVAVYSSITWNPYITEGLVGLLALGALGIIFWLRQPEPAEPPPDNPLPQAGPAAPLPIEITAEQLDRSRYN